MIGARRGGLPSSRDVPGAVLFAIRLTEVPAHDAQPPALEPATFRAFYDDALPRIYGYFLHRVGRTAAVAEELTQETFVAAVRELGRGRRPGRAAAVGVRDRAAQAARPLPAAGPRGRSGGA